MAYEDAVFALAARDGYVYQDGDRVVADMGADGGSHPSSWDPDGYNSMWESDTAYVEIYIYRNTVVWEKRYEYISELLSDLFAVEEVTNEEE